MLKRTLLLVSVIFAGSLLVASNEGVSKKSINNDNVLSIENNVDLKQIESIGVSARNSIINKLDESLIVKQGGLNKIFKKGYLYQKAGVILSGLEAENIDLNLFKEKENDKRKEVLMNAFDFINQKYGKNSLRIASEGVEKKWLMKKSRCSSSFTTNLKDLLIVRC